MTIPGPPPPCQDLLRRQAARHRRAHAILRRLAVLDRWRQLGNPVLCGATAYGLLVAPDIDVEVFGTLDVAAGFTVVGAIAADPAILKVTFLNATDTEDAGLGWEVVYRDGEQLWRIQMWLLPADYPGPRSSDLVPVLRAALDDRCRCAVLQIKEHLVAAGAHYRSIDVYRAVLDFGVTTADGYARWAVSHSSIGLIGWRPATGAAQASHLVGGGDAEKAKSRLESACCERAEHQAALPHGGFGLQHGAPLVERGERRSEAVEVVRQSVELQRFGNLPHHAG